jgi:hypothetical protein
VIGRVGRAVFAVGDEEHTKGGSSAGPQLTTAEKATRLAGLLNQQAKAQSASTAP